ncbi:hypothetical protein QUC31_001538 [Theobroma cacao]
MLLEGKSEEVEEENNTANALRSGMCQLPRLISSTYSWQKRILTRKEIFQSWWYGFYDHYIYCCGLFQVVCVLCIRLILRCFSVEVISFRFVGLVNYKYRL